MSKRRLRFLPLVAGGVFALAAIVYPAAAQDGTSIKGGQKFNDPDRLVDTFLADDQAALDEARTALTDARNSLDQAYFDLLQAQDAAAGEFAAIREAQASFNNAQSVFDDADLRHSDARYEFLNLQERHALSPAAKTAAKIEALTAKINNVLDPALAVAQVGLDSANRELLRVETGATGAKQAIDDALTVADDSQTAIDVAQGEFDLAAQSLDAERAAVEFLVAELSSEQLFAFNRSLNNALASNLLVDLDAEQLRTVIDQEYNKQQINFLTKAFEAEAIFRQIAERTGNDSFLEKATRQKEKFLARIEQFETGSGGGDALRTASGAGDRIANGVAKIAAKSAAKKAAREAARGGL